MSGIATNTVPAKDARHASMADSVFLRQVTDNHASFEVGNHGLNVLGGEPVNHLSRS
jgi:hypothetical protein